MSQLPEPETEEFNQLGPEARTLARWQNNYTSITDTRRETQAQATINEALTQ